MAESLLPRPPRPRLFSCSRRRLAAASGGGPGERASDRQTCSGVGGTWTGIAAQESVDGIEKEREAGLETEDDVVEGEVRCRTPTWALVFGRRGGGGG